MYKVGAAAKFGKAVFAAWLILSGVILTLAVWNVESFGLFYDEAVSGGMAKDFVQGSVDVLHMPGTRSIDIFGRPFPIFLSDYCGALKSWMLIPGLIVFEPSSALLRITSVIWSLAGLLLFMLWTRDMFGNAVMIVSALILSFDPSYYFVSLADWGPFVPSMFCRTGMFYFGMRWMKGNKMRDGLFAAVFAGLGLYGKIDFAVIIAGVVLALALVCRKETSFVIRNASWNYMPYIIVFIVVASPILMNIPDILKTASSIKSQSDLYVKYYTYVAMLDGSYIRRFMEAGGMYHLMFEKVPGILSPFPIAVLSSFSYLAFIVIFGKTAYEERRKFQFLLACMFILTVGYILLPGGIRMNHSILVYPFPHLLVGTALVTVWKLHDSTRHLSKRLSRIITVVAGYLVLSAHGYELLKTYDFINNTGGRGRWSNALSDFAAEVNGRSDIHVVSLDWGFNEQLAFLLKGPRLSEPFWDDPMLMSIESGPDVIYLVNAPEYSQFYPGLNFYFSARRAEPDRISIKPYMDRQGRVAFYAITRRL